MIKIDYPAHHPRIRKDKNGESIFDGIRKKWIKLTPEEWVRQNFIQYLVSVMDYPATLLAVEKEIRQGELIRRFDIVVYDKTMQPWMAIECKEMNVALDEQVLNQLLRYNISLKVKYLVITNGSHCYAFAIREGQLAALEIFPSFLA